MSYDEPKDIDNPVADESPGDDAESAEGAEGIRGTADPGKKFREMEVSEEEQAEIAQEREERLDPDNRPEGSEVDNTQRTFEDGKFVD